jgi:trimeric autotransporter adhesin
MTAPSTSGIPNTKITTGAPLRDIDLRKVFVDAETASSALTYTVVSASNTTVFFNNTLPSINNGILTLNYSGTTGTSNVIVRATDPNDPVGNNTVDATFTVEAIAATPTNDPLNGSNGEDYLDGAAGNDSITGLSLNDTLIGGAGTDTLAGGTGDDEYSVDVAGDAVTESPLEGTDTVKSKVTYTLGSNVEKLILEDAAVIDGIGNTLDNTITGNTAANKINGGAGKDSMTGSTGDDTYVVDMIGDVVTEGAGQGTDEVESFIDYTLGADVENLTLKGTAANGTGNTADNILTGNTAANILSGGAGSDDMSGGAGNDTYVVDKAADTVSGALGDIVREANTLNEVDTVQSSIAYALGNNVENLTLTGNASTGMGNTLNNTLLGNTIANTLDGKTGNDTLIGGAGNDIYIIEATDDIITETSTSSAEIDTVKSSITASLGTLGANLENLVLLEDGTDTNGTGNALDNTLTGNSSNNTLSGANGNDTLDGAAGDDTMKGAEGSDTYIVDKAPDTLSGATGDVVTETGSIVTEVDTVKSSIASYTLTDSVENLTLTDSAANGTGNDLKNTILGNAANNQINGAGDNDNMTGGAGNDIYFVNTPGDLVTELAEHVNGNTTVPGGTDTVKSAVNYTLGSNVEKLVLDGTSDINGTGNTLDNTLTGNTGKNTLSGGTGSDIMAGGTGDDTYIVDKAADTVSGALGDTVSETSALATEIDKVESSVNFTLGGNLENLTLTGINPIKGTGNGLNNTITGNNAANEINAGAGSDTMTGGAGNDIYVVDDLGDAVNENQTPVVASETDLVKSFITYTLGNNVEQLTLLAGNAAIDGTGNPLNNSITGNAGNNELSGLAGSDTMTGGLGNDTYVVDATGDVVTDEADKLDAQGNVTLSGGADEVKSSVTYTIGANLENLTLTLKGNTLDPNGKDNINATGNSIANTITGNSGNNTLSGGAGTDTLNGDGADALAGGAGDDTYIIYSTGTTDTITENAGAGTDTVSSSVSYILGSEIENLTLTGTAANGIGNSLNNKVTGNTAANTLNGSTGDDIMIGGTGNDSYKVDTSGDVVQETSNLASEIDNIESAVSYDLSTNVVGGTNVVNVEKLTITGSAVTATGNALSNTLTGNGGANTIDGKAGNDTMAGGGASDNYVVDSVGDVVTEAVGAGNADKIESSVTFTLGKGNDTILGENGENVEELTLTGTAAINGTGNELVNKITGNTAANILSGGAGTDSLIGGAGDDTYLADVTNDIVTEAGNEGTDTVSSSATYVLGNNLENLTLTGTAAIDGTGNSLANKITGNAGANTLTGGTNSDSMTGGTGNDIYIVDATGDVVTETSAVALESDTVKSSVDFTLGANLENLELTASAEKGTGNTLNNTILGNDLNNTIDGKVGTDTMTGGLGNDTYTVDATGDVVTETSTLNTEIDEVKSSATYTLGNNVENLELTGTVAINGTGNSLDNNITGNTAANLIDGKGGNDIMTGKAGNDTYTVDATDDVVTEIAAEGTDTVNSSATYTLSNANVENLTLTLKGTTLTAADNINGTGNASKNIITGNAGVNTLTGGGDTDTLIGGLGGDIYVVDVTGDVVTETSTLATEKDTVNSSATFTIGANIEDLNLTGSGGINGTGNTLNNTIKGNDGINTLSGGTGNDTMEGLAANDTYIVDAAGDSVIETPSGGTADLVKSSVTETLDAQVENLELTGISAINGTGNNLANTITGNTAANILSGGATLSTDGDIMSGGSGGDTYIVDSTGDKVAENSTVTTETDTVQSSITYNLGVTGVADVNVANVEKLTLTGAAAINGTGNTLNNTITGNTADNTLSGLTGNDSMIGGAGNDTYVVDATGDLVTELADGGITDLVKSDVTYTLGANVEDLTLTGSALINGTGNTLDNTIIGNSVANTLNGATGNDAMSGGTGDDIYVVDATGDVVTELASGGTDDLVKSSVTETLDAQVENLELTGTNAISGTGNDLANTITGNSAANTLTGLDGNDSMTGAAGNDIYVVNATGDLVTELAAGGTDLVQSSVTETLDAQVENLTLTGTTGTEAINGTGNALNNTITGNAGNNILSGDNDALPSPTSPTIPPDNDTMIGGQGNDTYVIDATGDVVTEAADVNVNGVLIVGGTDTVQSSVTETLDANVENLTLTGSGDINGTGNTGNNTITGNDGKNTLSGGAGIDALNGAGGDDTYIVDSTTDTIIDSAGTDLVSSSVSYTLGAGLDNLTLTGTSLINGTGNGDSNKLIGNSAANSLLAGAGNDTLTGGAGNDILTSGTGNDKFTFDSNAAFTSSGLGIDQIGDFASGTDKIVLDQTTFTALTNLSTQFAEVATDALASTSSALIVYSTATDNLFYNQNGTAAGYGTGAQFADLQEENTTLIASDFELQA